MTKKTNTANTTTNSNGINTDAPHTTNAAAEVQGNHANSDFAQALERDARQFADRNRGENGRTAKPMHVVVADFEYLYNQASHDIYRVSEGTAARPDIRWPFHRIAAASWLVLKFEPGADVPVVEELVSVTNYHADEQTIVERFFRTLEHYSDATLITWGGELKDLAVLRRCAGEFGLILPQRLRDLNPWAQTRLDLAIAVTGRANPVHLPEYCFATCLPCKPSPSKSIGELVQQAKWSAVSEQCMADVLSTTVIALRHMFSHGMITCHLPRSYDAIAKAAVKGGSASAFVRNSFAPWAFGQVAASRLKGVVYRAD